MCTWHPFPGFSGLLIGVLIVPILWLVAFRLKKFESYNLDPLGKAGAFEPILNRYIRIAEFLVGLASSSIVLLVGSSAFRATGHLPWVYASPLILLSFSVLWGLIFMGLLILNWENVQHGNPHTKLEYSRSEALGFGTLICFCLGYGWLVFAVTR